MKKYKCPACVSTQDVVKFGYRGKSHRFFCKKCSKHFSVNPHFIDTKRIMMDHLDGFSFRKLASRYDISPMTAWRICDMELKKLPNNNQFTHRFCDRFSSTLIVDGKYFSVKDQKHGYVLLWGVDYFKHDIPVFIIAPSESYHGWAKVFGLHRIVNHYPELLVCDDNINIKMAARDKFPGVHIQTCTNHFKENIRRTLKVRSETFYQPFMRDVEDIFSQKRADGDMQSRLRKLFGVYAHDHACLKVLTNIQRNYTELTGYRGIPGSPTTTNLIEGLNSHLESRLQALCSFQSVSHARLWMNAYILKRRYTKWTDCKGKFKNLNGKRGVDMTQKQGIVLPTYF